MRLDDGKGRRASWAPLAFLVGAMGSAATALGELARDEATFEREIVPILADYCFECHGDGLDRGDFSFERHENYEAQRDDKPFWDVVTQQVYAHAMPPGDKPMPTQDERDKLLAWIDGVAMWVDGTDPDPGHIALRRLNRDEYNRTVRDVFGVSVRPADRFPPDDTGYGFDNIGDVLAISPMLMERYLEAAQEVTAAALWTDWPAPWSVRLLARDLKVEAGNPGKQGEGLMMSSNATVSGHFDVPGEGRYEVEVRAGGSAAKGEMAKFRLEVGGKDEVIESGPGNYRVNSHRLEVQMGAPGRVPFRLSFINDLYDPEAEDPEQRDRNLSVEGVSMRGPLRAAEPVDVRAGKLLVGYDEGKAGVEGDGLRFRSETAARTRFGGLMEGRYELGLVGVGNKVSGEQPAIRVKVGEVDTFVEFPVERGGKVPVVTVYHPGGDLDLAVGLSGGAGEGGDGGAPILERLELRGPMADFEWDALPGFHRGLLEKPVPVAAAAREQLAREAIGRLGKRVMRRPLGEPELERYLGLARAVQREGERFEVAMAVVCEAMLCSPGFLYINGDVRGGGEVKGRRVPIDEFNLASRLSYFLWSSAPDRRLLDLAERGELRAGLGDEIGRMLEDRKSVALTENFLGQWLRLRDLALAEPDPELFGEFDGALAESMRKETEHLFQNIQRQNHDVTELLTADYTFLDERLARHYGIARQGGDGEFARVSLEGTPRRGLLNHASVLTVTSNPTRTNIVRRGQYVLESILGTPPPPAPEGVPPLEAASEGKEMSLREQFEKHRDHPSCSACHTFLDPMGLALEHFDAVGRWREEDGGKAIDASGQLLSGQTFRDHRELIALLGSDLRDRFVRHLAERMLTYALGRGVSYDDRPALDEVVAKAEAGGRTFRALVEAVVESVPFQYVRVEDVME